MRRVTRLLTVVLAGACACGSADSPARRALLESDAARRFVGAWDVRFTADATVMLSRAAAPGPVTGTLVFALNRNGPYEAPSLSGITHDGAYDVDFTPFGFAIASRDPASVAIARLGIASSRHQPGADSLWIVLGPGSEQFPVRMEGTIAGDSASGVWMAESRGAGGSSGRFWMRRREKW